MEQIEASAFAQTKTLLEKRLLALKQALENSQVQTLSLQGAFNEAQHLLGEVLKLELKANNAQAVEEDKQL